MSRTARFPIDSGHGSRRRPAAAARGTHRGRLASLLVALLTVSGLAAGAATAHAQGNDVERDAVVAAVQDLFDAMAAHDAEAIRAMTVAAGAVVAVRPDGSASGSSLADFAETIGSFERSILERMWSPRVLVHGDMAMLWTPYDFYADGNRSHCGIDSFSLVRSGGKWLVAGITYTVEPDGCAALDAPPLGQEDAPRDPEAVVRAYEAAWNEPDVEARRALLQDSWAADARYTDPTVDLTGREALIEHISGFLAQESRPRIELASGIDVHHGLLRFRWRLVAGDGAEVIEGVDFGVLGPDGRLQSIVGFFGPFPEGD